MKVITQSLTHDQAKELIDFFIENGVILYDVRAKAIETEREIKKTGKVTLKYYIKFRGNRVATAKLLEMGIIAHPYS